MGRLGQELTAGRSARLTQRYEAAKIDPPCYRAQAVVREDAGDIGVWWRIERLWTTFRDGSPAYEPINKQRYLRQEAFDTVACLNAAAADVAKLNANLNTTPVDDEPRLEVAENHAPRLLAALKHLVRWHDQLSPSDIAMAEAAIAAAKGRS